MMYLLLYVILALCSMMFVFWQSYGSGGDYLEDHSEERQKTVLIFSALFWPLTIALICGMTLWERFSYRIYKKAKQLYHDYTTPDEVNAADERYEFENKAIKRMPPKELKYLLFADKIGAIELHETSKILVERILMDYAFEKQVLNEK